MGTKTPIYGAGNEPRPSRLGYASTLLHTSQVGGFLNGEVPQGRKRRAMGAGAQRDNKPRVDKKYTRDFA